MKPDSSPRLQRRVLVLVDLAGYAAAFGAHDDAAMASFTQEYYRLCAEELEGAGGRVVKFLGDACLCVFPEDGAAAAVDAVRALTPRVDQEAAARGVGVALGANLHLGEVMEGLFGPEDHARYDVIGAAMNQTARMGRGGVVRISGTLLRALPDGERPRWLPEGDDVFVPA